MIQNLFEIETFCNTNLFIFIFDQFNADLMKNELWNKLILYPNFWVIFDMFYLNP